jgi:hypothetical protein
MRAFKEPLLVSSHVYTTAVGDTQNVPHLISSIVFAGRKLPFN